MTTFSTTSAPLVVGLGSPDRGDDAVGPLVARAVSAAGVPGVDVVEQEDPTALVELCSGRDLVVVVDAVRSGVEPGAVVVLQVGAGSGPMSEAAWRGTGRGGTHAFGLGPAVELARALGRLPERVVVVGVEAESFEHGEPLSPAVADAVQAAAETVRHTVERALMAASTPEGRPACASHSPESS